MGRPQNPQRAAIIGLASEGDRPPAGMEGASIFLESGEEIILAGTSTKNNDPYYAKGNEHLNVIGVNYSRSRAGENRCPIRLDRPSDEYSYVVLVRDATDEERAEFYLRPGVGKPCVAAVELLRYVRTEQGQCNIRRIIFARTGKTAAYVDRM